LHKRSRTSLEGNLTGIETEEIGGSSSEPEEEEDWLAALSDDTDYSHVEGSPIANTAGREVAEPAENAELDIDELNIDELIHDFVDGGFVEADDILDW